MKLASWPWPVFLALIMGALLGLGLERWVRRPSSWVGSQPFPRLGELFRLLDTGGGHLAIALVLIVWGTLSLLFDAGKAIGQDIVKLTLGAMLAIIKPSGNGGSGLRGRVLIRCPFCKKEFDPKQGAGVKPDDPDG